MENFLVFGKQGEWRKYSKRWWCCSFISCRTRKVSYHGWVQKGTTCISTLHGKVIGYRGNIKQSSMGSRGKKKYILDTFTSLYVSKSPVWIWLFDSNLCFNKYAKDWTMIQYCNSSTSIILLSNMVQKFLTTYRANRISFLPLYTLAYSMC